MGIIHNIHYTVIIVCFLRAVIYCSAVSGCCTDSASLWTSGELSNCETRASASVWSGGVRGSRAGALWSKTGRVARVWSGSRVAISFVGSSMVSLLGLELRESSTVGESGFVAGTIPPPIRDQNMWSRKRTHSSHAAFS